MTRLDRQELTAITEDAVAELEQLKAARQEKPEETPPHLKCPIEMARFRSPVVVADGHTFERAAIKRWLEGHDTNPVTGAPPLAPPARLEPQPARCVGRVGGGASAR